MEGRSKPSDQSFMLSSGRVAVIALGAIVRFARRGRKIAGSSVDGSFCDDAHHRPSYDIGRVVRPTGDLDEGDGGCSGISGGAGLRVGAAQSSGDCNASRGVA